MTTATTRKEKRAFFMELKPYGITNWPADVNICGRLPTPRKFWAGTASSQTAYATGQPQNVMHARQCARSFIAASNAFGSFFSGLAARRGANLACALRTCGASLTEELRSQESIHESAVFQRSD